MAATDTLAKTSSDTAMSGGVIPCPTLTNASAAIDFYKRAFGAIEVSRMPMPDGKRLMHVHMKINGGSFVFQDGMPEHGRPAPDVQTCYLMLVIDDIDAWWDRAIKAGGEPVMVPEKMFWGDRYGQFRDPFGVTWAFDEPARA